LNREKLSNSASPGIEVNLKRLFSTLICDIRIQYRSGLYLISGLAILILILGLRQLPRTTLETWLPILLLANIFLQTLSWVVYQIRQEKANGTFTQINATPLRPHEYLGGKALSLAMLLLIQTNLIGFLTLGWHFQPIYFVISAIVLFPVSTLLGYLLAVRAKRFSD
jgi:hypothetical protein